MATISQKVTSGTLGGGAVALVTAILIQAVPAWHAGLPTWLQQLIPVLVGMAGYFGAGYQATHKATVGEVQAAVADAEQVLAIVAAIPATAPAHASPAPTP